MNVIPIDPSHPLGFQREAQRLKRAPSPSTAKEFADFERKALALGRKVADQLIAFHLLKLHNDDKFLNRVARTFRRNASQAYRGHGKATVTVRLPGGGSVEVKTPYQIIDRRNKPGRKRAPGKRGATGSGRYPVLAQLGIEEKASPRVRYLTAYQLVTGDSYRSSLEALRQHGLDLDNKALVRIGRQVARDFILHRDERLLALAQCEQREELPLAGRRVLVSMDGGRVKLRFNHTRGRRKKNGRRGFTTEWKEPKGFIIECLDEHGKPDPKVLPFIDFTLLDADTMFAMLERYLRALGVELATHVVVVADGAEWIWNRVKDMMEDVGVKKENLTQLLDFYHAAQHLDEAVKACTSMHAAHQSELFEELRGYLRKSQRPYLLARLRQLAKGRRAKPIKKVMAYFEARKDLLGYAKAREAKLPIGSGAIESAIRRVLNLRFKSSGTTWSAEHIGPLLHMRALVKTGRFDLAFTSLLAARTPLVPDGGDAIPCPYSGLNLSPKAA